MTSDLGLTQQQLRAAQNGCAQALEAMFARYLPRVRGMVAARTGRTLRQLNELDDLVQETLRDALLGLQRIDAASEGLFAHWLATCVENNLRDALRRQRAQKRGGGRQQRFADLEQSLSESLFPDGKLSLSQVLDARELEDRIEQQLLRLGARYREVIVLRVRGGLDYREIAETMGLPSENTANVLFLRARKRLMELVEGPAAG
jgi:RNA polymerase sigma-70 factor, ECF subfamily